MPVSEAQKKANKKWNEANREKVNENAKSKYAKRYEEKGDILREQQKKSYAKNKEAKLERLQGIRDFHKTEFGTLCAIY